MTNSDNPNTKHKEFWLEKVESESGTDLAVWDFRPPFDAEFASSKDDFIHVIEHSALTALESELKDEKIKVKELLGGLKSAYGFVLHSDNVGFTKIKVSELITKYEVPNE